MKKLILGFAVFASIAFVSCKDKKASPEKQDATKQEVTKTDKSVDVPAFENEKVAEYIKKYDAYFEEYKKVVESKDMTKFQTLGTKGQELAKEGQALITDKLSPGDMKKLQEYMKEKAAEMQEVAKKMMQ